MVQDWKMALREQLATQEEKIFAQRDKYERDMCEITGMQLTSEQIWKLRQACDGYEQCERGITRVQDRMSDLG